MTEGRYHLSARMIHWGMAAGFVFMWACGYAMTTLVEDDSPLEEFLFDLHISTGVTLLALLGPAHRRPPCRQASAAARLDPEHGAERGSPRPCSALCAAGAGDRGRLGGDQLRPATPCSGSASRCHACFPETGGGSPGPVPRRCTSGLAYTMLVVSIGPMSAAAFRHRRVRWSRRPPPHDLWRQVESSQPEGRFQQRFTFTASTKPPMGGPVAAEFHKPDVYMNDRRP